MFQEAAATASDVKAIVPGAKYYLLCEWLDMTPISTSSTAIDEVIILRQAKRLSSNVRSAFATARGRQNIRTEYVEYLTNNPLACEPFTRYLNHLDGLFSVESNENDVLARGYF